MLASSPISDAERLDDELLAAGLDASDFHEPDLRAPSSGRG